MASDLVDGDYLGSYRRFIVDFLDKVNPDDQLPIKTSGHDVTEAEMVGEVIHMTLQYLNQQLCPPSLQCYIVKLVIEEIKATCRKQPESCGFRHDEKTYEPLKLMQAVASKVNEICQRYLENSRLALLPPPPSTPMPLANAFAIRNNRRKMEDRHVILHDLNTIFNIKDDSIASYYAVFDGHAGYQAAVFCAAHLHQYLAESCYYPTDPERALRDAFVTADEIFVQKTTRQTLSSGTTAVCALILNRKLYVAWAGDSQAALAKRGVVEQLVNPHKPDRNDERERVEQMGGTVMYLGIWRVNGNLAVSRAIGDAQYKPYVTGEPEIRCITLDGDEDFLIIGCDGLWDSVTENEAAALVYRDLYRDPYNYESASQRLVEYAKSEGSIDNITVIVVFLSSPSKIVSRFSNYVNPLLADVQLDNMEPDNRYLSNANGQYDVNSSFVKQTATNNGSPDMMDDEDPYGNFANKSSNGKHRENGGGLVESRDYDAEEDDEDLGPETDVDALDDVSEPMPTLADVSRELFPEKQDPCEIYQSEERMDDETPPSPQATKTNQQALIPETDNVGDSEDSEDEWNYYRIDPNKEKDSAGAAGFSPEGKSDNETREENVEAASSPGEPRDFLADEKNDSDSSSEPDSERENRSIALVDNEISVEKCSQLPSSFSSEKIDKLEKEDPEKFDSESESESESEKDLEDSDLPNLEKPNNPDNEEEDMDFQLNPNAAEFVPVSPTQIISSRMDHLDAPIAGSPLKQTPVMDDITIPSRREFEKEVRNRPCEIEEKTSCTNGQLLGELDDDESAQQKPSATQLFNLDESEVSSTKAEFGDESSFTPSEFHRTGISNLDGSYNDSYGAFDDSGVDPMTKSFGPGDFMALGNPVDLNAVHDLPDDDLMQDENNPEDITQEAEKMNLENIQASETITSSVESQLKEQSDFDPFSTNQNADILDSSSPVLSPSSPINEMHFGNEFRDNRVESPDSAVMEPQKMDFDTEKSSEQHEIRSPSPTLEYNETNVTSKLLEMDLEDRGSQDCAFEKCNEKFDAEKHNFGAEEDKFEANDDHFAPEEHEFTTEVEKLPAETVIPPKNDDLADFLSSPVPQNDFDAFSSKESLPVESPQVEEVEKLAETFGDLRANEESSTAAPEVPVLLNPLDLHVENTQITQEDVNLEDSPDYQINKAPESPEDILSPFPKQDDKKNPFESADFGSPISFGDSQNQQQILQDFEEKHEIIEPEIIETKTEIVETSPEILETKSEIPETPEVVETKPEIVETPEVAEIHSEIVESQEIQKLEPEIEQKQPEIEQTHPEIEQTHPEIAQTHPDIEEQFDHPSETVEVTSTLKLSESLQEFTGLEEQLNPENNTKISNGLEDNFAEIRSEETSKPAEEIVEQITKVETIQSPLEEEKKPEIPSESEPAKPEKSEIISAPIIAAVATAAAAGTVAAAASKATKPSKPLASKTASKTAPTTKSAANKLSPTSPTKPAVSARTSSLTAAKKTTTTTTAARPTKLETGKAPISSKTTTASAKTTLSAAKPAGRLSVSSPRTKPSPSTISKTSASTADKKPTTNGEATKSTIASTKVASTAAKAPSKPLVKSSTTRATSSTSTTTTTAARARATASTTTSSVTKTLTKTTTGNVGTTTQRPKTAPTGGATSLTSKSRLSVSAKAPITDKQVKETANKQISSSRTSTTTTASKTTRTAVSSSTTTATRRLTASKTTSSSTNAAPQTIPPPIRKPAPITRPGGKNGAVGATTTAAAPTTNGKAHVTKTTASTKTKVVLQNGVCTADQETKIVTSTTSNEDEDVPKKDLSPVEPPTDNQLIITAD